MSQLGNQVGIAGKARYYGIPAGTSVSWTGISGTARTGTVFRSINFTPEMDTSDAHGLSGEFQTRRGVRPRLQGRFEIVPVSGSTDVTTLLAQNIAVDPPMKNTLLTVANATNSWAGSSTQVLPKPIGASNANWLITGVSGPSFTPDGDAVLNIDAELFLDDAFAALTLAAMTVS